MLIIIYQIDWYASWPHTLNVLISLDLTEIWSDLKLSRGHLEFSLSLTNKKKNIILSGLACPTPLGLSSLLLGGHFRQSYLSQTKTRPCGHWSDLWCHELSRDLKCGYRSPRLVVVDTLRSFSLSSSSIRDETARCVVFPPPPGHMYKTVRPDEGKFRR